MARWMQLMNVSSLKSGRSVPLAASRISLRIAGFTVFGDLEGSVNISSLFPFAGKSADIARSESFQAMPSPEKTPTAFCDCSFPQELVNSSFRESPTLHCASRGRPTSPGLAANAVGVVSVKAKLVGTNDGHGTSHIIRAIPASRIAIVVADALPDTTACSDIDTTLI